MITTKSGGSYIAGYVSEISHLKANSQHGARFLCHVGLPNAKIWLKYIKQSGNM